MSAYNTNLKSREIKDYWGNWGEIMERGKLGNQGMEKISGKLTFRLGTFPTTDAVGSYRNILGYVGVIVINPRVEKWIGPEWGNKK